MGLAVVCWRLSKEGIVNDQENKRELVELLGEAVYVPDTSPPVYMLDGVLIGYDKLEQMRVIATTSKREAEPVENRPKNPFGVLARVFARAGMKLATMRNHNAAYATKG